VPVGPRFWAAHVKAAAPAQNCGDRPVRVRKNKARTNASGALSNTDEEGTLFLVEGDDFAHQLLCAFDAGEAQGQAALRQTGLALEAAEIGAARVRADQDQFTAGSGDVGHRGSIAHRHASGEIHVRPIDDEELTVRLGGSDGFALDREAGPAVVKASAVDLPGAGQRAILSEAGASEGGGENGADHGGFGKGMANH